MNKTSKVVIKGLLVTSLVFGVQTGNAFSVLASGVTSDTAKTAETHNQPNSFNMIKSALESSNQVGYFDTKEIGYKEVHSLIQEVIDTDANRFFVKRWVSYSSGKIEFFYHLPKDEIKKRTNETNKKADDVLKTIIKPNFTDFDKIKVVHDYLVLNTAYDYENYKNGTTPNDSFTAYGVFNKGFAVCDGYARATQLLLGKLGIESIYVTGELKNGGYHAWNMVKLNDKYYHMDVTWDDPVPNREGYVGYNYFLIDSKQLAKDRNWEQENYPLANNGNYNTKLVKK